MLKAVCTFSVTGTIMIAGAAIAAPPEFHDAVAKSEPILHYQLNETEGDAVNYGSLGPDFNATYHGAPMRGAATSSGDAGVRCTSVTDFIESMMPAPTQLTGNPTFTVETVVFVPGNAASQNYPPFLHWGAAGTMNSVYFSLHHHSNNRAFAGFYNGGLRASNTFTNDQWLHIVMVREGGGNAAEGTTLYIDGIPVPLEADTFLCCNFATPTVTSTTFRINRATDSNRFFQGTMDEIVLYDRALTQDEVCAHYAALDLCTADINGDEQVDVDDLLTLLSSWGPCDDCASDTNDDGVVDVTDLLFLLGAWGPCNCATP